MHRKIERRINPPREQGALCVAYLSRKTAIFVGPDGVGSRRLHDPRVDRSSIRGLGQFVELRRKSAAHNALADATGLHGGWICGILPTKLDRTRK